MRHSTAAVLGILMVAAVPTTSSASAYVFPSVTEAPGSGGGKKASTFSDTQFVFTYTPTVLGGSGEQVEVKLSLFDDAQSASLALSKTGAPICAPCVVNLNDSTNRRAVLNLETQIVDAGGFADALFDDYAVVTVSSDDMKVGLAMVVVSSASGTPTPILTVAPKTIAALAP